MSLPRRSAFLSMLVLWSFPIAMVNAQAPKQQASSTSTSARTAIDAANKRFVDRFNKGDIEGAAKVYASDAIVLPPNGDLVRGQKAITDFWQGGYSSGIRNIVLTTTEFAQHGSYAHELGTYQLEVRKPDGSVVARDNGKYMVLWKRSAGGDWQWYRDIYNSSVPAPASK